MPPEASRVKKSQDLTVRWSRKLVPRWMRYIDGSEFWHRDPQAVVAADGKAFFRSPQSSSSHGRLQTRERMCSGGEKWMTVASQWRHMKWAISCGRAPHGVLFLRRSHQRHRDKRLFAEASHISRLSEVRIVLLGMDSTCPDVGALSASCMESKDKKRLRSPSVGPPRTSGA